VFEVAIVPLSMREPLRRVHAIRKSLAKYGTERLVLLHATSGRTDRADQELSAYAESLERYATEQPRAAGGPSGDGGTLPHPSDADRTRQSSEEASEETSVAVSAERLPALETHVTTGAPATAIVRSPRECGASFICIPWKRKSWLQRTLIGSTTKDVVRMADVPVLVLKGYRRALSSQETTEARVVYATDFHEVDAVVLPFFSEGGLAVSELHILHVGERAPDPIAEQNRIATVIAGLNRLAREAVVPKVERITWSGNPKRAIPRYGRLVNADLVIVGKADTAGGVGAILGSTAEAVAYAHRISVLVVPRSFSPHRFDRPHERTYST